MGILNRLACVRTALCHPVKPANYVRSVVRWNSKDVEKDVPYETSIHRAGKSDASSASFPTEADVVVIGAGSLGCSTAYHLAKQTSGSVVLLEKHRITSGTTWHTAGILWTIRGSESETLMQLQTRELISEILPAETGESAGWLKTGTLMTAKNRNEMRDITQLTSFGKGLGVEIHEVKPSEVPDIHPLVNTSDLYGAVFSPGDGTIDPATYCMSYIQSAKKYGAKVFENCSVTDIVKEQDYLGLDRVVGVQTDKGLIRTNNVVNCAGAWAPYIGKMAGVRIPQLTYQHAYIVTQGIKGIFNTPMVKDHGTVYMKPQGDALQFGGYEMNPHLVENLPEDFAFGLYDLDWDLFTDHLEAAVNRIPAIGETGIRSTVCGPESFTPDGRPNMGESPEVRGFFAGSGFNSGGMMLGGGAGRQLAHWVAHGRPEIDMFNCDIRRYPTNLTNYNKWLLETCHERFAKRYSLVYPYDQSLGGRNQRLSKLHSTDSKLGAMFGCRYAYERPAYYLKDQPDLQVKDYDFYGSYGNQKHDLFPYLDTVNKDCTYDYAESHKQVGRECLTCRTSAILLDSSYMAKIFITGKDANQLASLAFTRDVAKSRDGQFLYSLMLNQNAGIEGDVIVTRVANPSTGNKEYYVTFSSSGALHCKMYLQNLACSRGLQCIVEDRTEERSILSIQGPKSRDILAPLVKDPEILKSLKYAQWKNGSVAGKDVMIGRLSFVGELGFEIHALSDDVKALHDAILAECDNLGATVAGYRAMESLSSETGFHHWSHTIHASDNPAEADMLRFCDDSTNYVGSKALAEIKKKPLKKKLVCLTVDADVPIYGHEAIWMNDSIVGILRSGDYAHALDTNIGYGYVEVEGITDDQIAKAEFMIERQAQKYKAKAFKNSPFDPTFERIRGKYSPETQSQLLDRLNSYQ